jgi:hypothetical protein
VNHENIILKHGDAYDKWGRQIAAFLNANGPSQFYHVAGKPSALRK